MIGEYSGLAVTMPAAVAIGFGIGWALDRWLQTGPIFEIIFVILGAVAGMAELVRVVQRTERSK